LISTVIQSAQITNFAELLLRFILQQLLNDTGLKDFTTISLLLLFLRTLAEVVRLRHSTQ